jgi:hypothetical protein
LILLLAPVALRVIAAVEGSETLRCAIACGHAATPGAACCPLSRAAGKGAAVTACPRPDPQSLAPGLPAQPGLVGTVYRLAAPERGSIFEADSAVAPRGPSPHPPDHVPLLLS